MSTLQALPAARPSRTGRLHYSDPACADWLYMIGDSLAIPYGAAVTDGRFEFLVIEAHAGAGPPLHTHAEAETFAILAGEFEFTSYVDGVLSAIVASPGDAVHVPGGVPHTFKCLSSAGGQCLAFVQAAGREGFFREVGQPVAVADRRQPAAAPPDLERVLAAAQRHGLALWDPAVSWHGPSAEYFPAVAARTGSRRIAGEVFHVAASAEHPGGGLLLVDSSSQPGSGVPLHCHPQAEVFYAVEGEYQFGTLDEDGREVWFSLPAGASVLIPANAPHAFSNPAPTPARCLAFFHGTDLRGFFELGVPVADPAAERARPFELDMGELGRLMSEAGKHGMSF
jgi:quercetin dioxygenase-like cupin family protein